MRVPVAVLFFTQVACLFAVTPPIAFEENRGQAPREAAFLVRAGSTRVFLTADGAVMDGVRIRLSGAKPGRPVGRHALTAKSNYLTGADRSQWHIGIPNYQEVRYAHAYPAIDLIWHARGSQLEHDFELAPGADARRIRMFIDGAMPAITAGDLVAGSLRMRQPHAYQDGREVACRLDLHGRTVGFVLGEYDHRRPLTIDPVLVFSTLLGGSGFSYARSVALDAGGNLYLAGTTDAADFPITSGALQTTYNNVPCSTSEGMLPCDDIFVSKFSGDGSTLLYSTYLGGGGYNDLLGMALDASGSVYLVGDINLPNLTHLAGYTALGSDPVVVKLSADGSTLLYATTLPLGASGIIHGMAVDNAGAVYLTGESSAALPLVNPFQSAVKQPLVFKTGNSAEQWQGFADDLPGLLVESIAVAPTNPQTVYLGTFQTLYRSGDGGSHWSAILGSPPPGAANPFVYLLPESIAVDPANSQTVYLGTLGNGIYKSIDGGATWSAASTGASQSVRMIAIDPANTKILYSANDDAVYKSTDGAATWNATSLTTGSNVLLIDPSTPSTIYAGGNTGVMKSIDAGVTWTAMANGFTRSTGIICLAIDPVNPQLLYATTTINFPPYATYDGGAHWTQGQWPPESDGLLPYVLWLLVDPSVHTTVWAVTDSGLRVSRDSGATWTAPPTDLPYYNLERLASSPDGSIYAIANNFSSDAFALKLDPSGSKLVYSTYLGGSGPDSGESIAVDGAGRAYIAGFTSSFDFPVANAFQSHPGGGNDAFVAVLDSAGSQLAWSTYLGGSGDDLAGAIAVDRAGSVHLAGSTSSADFPLAQASQSRYAASGAVASNAFAAKLKGDGSGLIFSTYFGGSAYDYATAVAADAAGNTYMAGETTSKDLPTANAIQPELAGPQNGFVAAWNGQTGGLQYSTYLGGSNQDSISGMAVDSAGNAYVAGGTNSPDFPRKYAYQYTFTGEDAFLAKIAAGTAGPPIAISGAANSASYGATVAPGEIVSIFGKQLAVTPATAGAPPLPLQLADVHVTVNGIAAPLLYAAPLQINAQIPYETAAGTAQIQVTSGAGTAVVNVPVAAAAPAIFTLNSLGSGAGAVEHALTGQLVTDANPASPGEVVAVYCTGLGAVSPAVADGAAAPLPPAQTVLAAGAFYDGAPAQVIYAGPAPGFAGLYQVNVQIPLLDVNPGPQTLMISTGGAVSNTVTIAVR
jgi:uncharacterized protein (TIGR03437 family)